MDRDTPLIIAHRGASGYLPEHTLPAKALAFGQGADYLEQDVVATRDDELIVLHDIHLDTVTDVAAVYPERARSDGRYYARDFSMDEIRTLNAHERTGKDGKTAVYPQRFPPNIGRFSIPTLREEIEMVQGLNRASGRDVGIYPEIKQPAWHHEEGVDVARIMLDLLGEMGYRKRADKVFVQCFDAAETRRLREELGTELKIVQLIADDAWGESGTRYSEMMTEAGLEDVATYADAIGPWLPQLYEAAGPQGWPVASGLSERAHKAGLHVHPYTFRADELASGFEDFATMLRWFRDFAAVDGVFTDFPDLARAAFRTPATDQGA